MINILKDVGLSGVLDIAFIAVLIYSILVWFKQTRALFVLIGLFLIGGAYLIARLLGMTLTTTVFQAFFAIIVVAVVVIFQEEIKRFLEQLASRSLVPRFRLRRVMQLPRREVEILVQTVYGLARERTGALFVLWGRDPIGRHLTGGVDLNGEISEALLRSIFDPHSIGHDGAVIIRDNRIAEFSVHLPLSKNLRKLRNMGTRHAAALGLSELTDALSLVVSEEHGTISIARHGDLRQVRDIDELRAGLLRFYEEIAPAPARRSWRNLFTRNYVEKIVALVLTVFLWFFFVYESRVDMRTFLVPVEPTDLPQRYIVSQIDPPSVEISLSGPRRAFRDITESSMRVELKMTDVRTGTQKRLVPRSSVTVPNGLTLENIQPNEVSVQIDRIR